MIQYLFSYQGFLSCQSHYREALRIRPQYVTAWENLGLVLLNSGKNTTGSPGSRVSSKCVLYPLVKANSCCLFSCFSLGRPKEAEKCYLKSLSIKPNSADGNINLAHLLRVTERFREADSQYQKALTLRPNHPQLNYFHGVVLEKLGNLKVSCPFSVTIILVLEITENLLRRAEENRRLKAEYVFSSMYSSSAQIKTLSYFPLSIHCFFVL